MLDGGEIWEPSMGCWGGLTLIILGSRTRGQQTLNLGMCTVHQCSSDYTDADTWCRSQMRAGLCRTGGSRGATGVRVGGWRFFQVVATSDWEGLAMGESGR